MSCHRVREAVAGGWLRFHHVGTKQNAADILAKSLAWNEMKAFVEPMLMWKGDTDDAPIAPQLPEGSDVDPGFSVACLVADDLGLRDNVTFVTADDAHVRSNSGFELPG